MPTPAPDDEALQRICKDEAASHFFDLTPGSITAKALADSIEEYAKAVARRYAATVGMGVPEEVQRLRQALHDVAGKAGLARDVYAAEQFATPNRVSEAFGLIEQFASDSVFPRPDEPALPPPNSSKRGGLKC